MLLSKEQRKVIAEIKRLYGEANWENFVKKFARKGKLKSLSSHQIKEEFTNRGLNHHNKLFRENIANHFNDYIFPVIKETSDLDIVSVGCAGGSDIFSLSILIQETIDELSSHRGNQSIVDNLNSIDLEGLDISAQQVAFAKSSKVRLDTRSVNLYQNFIKAGYLEKFKDQSRNTNYKVNLEILNRCSFKRWDILSKPLPSKYQIILCCNVLLHFSEEGKELALENLVANMHSGSRLILEKPYDVPSGRLTLLDELRFAWAREYNEFLRSLEERDLGLFQIDAKYNVYEKR